MGGAAAAWVPAALGAVGAASSGGKGGGGGEIPAFFSRTAGPIATDMRRALNLGAPGYDFQFDDAGNLLPGQHYGQPKLNKSGSMRDFMQSAEQVRNAGNLSEISANEKALFEAQNFFSNLYNNPDITGSLDVFRRRLNPAADGRLISDPFYDLVRERGTAQAIEAGRRVGGLRSSGTSRGVANFLTDAEAQQAQFETGLASEAANALFNLSFLRGQAGFIPTQTYGNVLSGLGGGVSYAPTPQFSNLGGQAGGLVGASLGATQANKGSKPNTSTALPFNQSARVP